MHIGDQIMMVQNFGLRREGDVLTVKSVAADRGHYTTIFVGRSGEPHELVTPLRREDLGAIWIGTDHRSGSTNSKENDDKYFLTYSDGNANFHVEEFSSIAEAQATLDKVEVNEEAHVYSLVKGKNIQVKKKFVIE